MDESVKKQATEVMKSISDINDTLDIKKAELKVAKRKLERLRREDAAAVAAVEEEWGVKKKDGEDE